MSYRKIRTARIARHFVPGRQNQHGCDTSPPRGATSLLRKGQRARPQDSPQAMGRRAPLTARLRQAILAGRHRQVPRRRPTEPVWPAPPPARPATARDHEPAAPASSRSVGLSPAPRPCRTTPRSLPPAGPQRTRPQPGETTAQRLLSRSQRLSASPRRSHCPASRTTSHRRRLPGALAR